MYNTTETANIISLPKDIINLLTFFIISPIDLYMLRISHRNFKYRVKHDTRLLTFEHALESKNHEYIKLVERTRDCSMNIPSMLHKIIKTSNFNIISYLIPDPKKYIKEIKLLTTKLIQKCDPESICYLLNNNFLSDHVSCMINENRFDIIDYCYEKGIDLLNKFKSYVVSTSNIRVLNRLCSLGFSIEKKHLKYIIESRDANALSILKNVINGLKIDLFDKYLSEYDFVDGMYVNECIAMFLADIGYSCFLKYVSFKGIDYVPVPQDDFNSLSDPLFLPPYMSFIRRYEFAYHIIKNRKVDLYNHIIFEQFEKANSYNIHRIFPISDNLELLFNLCDLNNPQSLYDYVTICSSRDCNIFLLKYIDDLKKCANSYILDKLIQKFTCNIDTAIQYYKNGIDKLIYCLIKAPHSNGYLDNATLQYICMRDDFELIKNLYLIGYIYAPDIMEYCTPCTITKFLELDPLVGNKEKRMEYMQDTLIKRGHLDAIKHYVSTRTTKKINIFHAFLNCPRAASIVLKYHYSQSYSFLDVISYYDKRYVNSGYYQWAINQNLVVNEEDMLYIIKKDQIILHEYARKYLDIRKNQNVIC